LSSAAIPSQRLPEEMGVLLLQACATVGFAVVSSTLILYLTAGLHFSVQRATTLVGVFGALNYGLRLLAGSLGGRLLSYRTLFTLGMALQVVGCAWLANHETSGLYGGLSFVIAGNGLTVTCVNMMLTHRFAGRDERRERAFFWSYAGTNVGFFVGFVAAGHYQLTESYARLFVVASVSACIAVAVTLGQWKSLAGHDGSHSEARGPWLVRARLLLGCAIVLGCVPVVWVLIHHAAQTETLVKVACAVVAVALLGLTLRSSDPIERKRMGAYLVLAVGALVFWTLYEMASSGLQLFAAHDVDRKVGGIEIAPQWLNIINSVVVVFGGPLLSVVFERLRRAGWRIDLPRQFASALVLMGLGFLVLPLGIAFADMRGLVSLSWLVSSYVLQSVGELLISPIGYAMIGVLAPRRYQGVMMGTWMLITGLASLLAGDLSGLLPELGATSVSQTASARLFAVLGGAGCSVGFIFAALAPWLRSWIGAPPPGAADG
jgi:proton-dependent oligopeptide transporter, POT family